MRIRLEDIAHARSGDKGDGSNVGVIAYTDAGFRLLQKELTTEPPQIADLYRIVLRRLEPVGLVYLWPETRS